MKLTPLLIVLSIMSGCDISPLENTTVGNNVRVSLLFEHDSIRIYRFYDGGNAHYFAKDMTTQTLKCGKHHYEETIQTTPEKD